MADFIEQTREDTAPRTTPTVQPTILLIRESWVKSWLRDASTFALFIALIGIGVLLQSVALQWVGAIIGFIHIAGSARRMLKHNSYTIPQARVKLDELEVQV